MIPTQLRAFQPEHVERLFARLTAMYGNRFIDMWRDINMADVKSCWADELRVFSVDQIGMAIEGLKAFPFPPTLPEFLQLCEQARLQRPRVIQPALPAMVENPDAVEKARADCFANARKLGMVKVVEAAMDQAAA